jgi:hypothetical protein
MFYATILAVTLLFAILAAIRGCAREELSRMENASEK